MKNIYLLVIGILLLNGCYSYQSYVSVNNSSDVPKGSKEIICKADVNLLLNALTLQSILYTKFENGYETQEILLDEGTKAKYRILYVDSTMIVIPFWGITEKVASQIASTQTIIAGHSSYKYDAGNWDRVIYDDQAKRPKMVFDYGVQLVRKVSGDISYR